MVLRVRGFSSDERRQAAVLICTVLILRHCMCVHAMQCFLIMLLLSVIQNL